MIGLAWETCMTWLSSQRKAIPGLNRVRGIPWKTKLLGFTASSLYPVISYLTVYLTCAYLMCKHMCIMYTLMYFFITMQRDSKIYLQVSHTSFSSFISLLTWAPPKIPPSSLTTSFFWLVLLKMWSQTSSHQHYPGICQYCKLLGTAETESETPQMRPHNKFWLVILCHDQVWKTTAKAGHLIHHQSPSPCRPMTINWYFLALTSLVSSRPESHLPSKSLYLNISNDLKLNKLTFYLLTPLPDHSYPTTCSFSYSPISVNDT